MKTLKHLFTALLLLCSMAASAQSFEVDGIRYNVTNSTDKTVGVQGVTNGYTGSLVIPESVVYNDVTYSVTSIGNNAFDGCRGLTGLTIGNGVTSIGNCAFYNCSGLTGELVIPNAVTSIGVGAFYNCSGLTGELVIPNAVTSIGNDAFYGTAWYKNQPDGVVYAGKFLYKYKGTMPSNTSVVVKEGTLGIVNYAFEHCSGLTSIEIPNCVTSIGEGAFSGCSGLTSVEIPNSVTSIGSYAFQDCSGLTSVEIGNSVTSIGEYAFRSCTDLTGELVIPNSVTSIGNNAFQDCFGLTSVVIGNSVTNIGSHAFVNCSGLTSVEFNAENCTINGGSYPIFDGCTALSTVTIGENVKTIPGTAFRGCSGLTSIEIPAGITGIGERAFENCSGLASIEIPAGVTSIGERAFENCSGLTSLTIGSGVTSIGGRAFHNCTGLKNLHIEDSEVVLSLGNDADENGYTKGLFYYCPLETLYLGRDLSYDYGPFANIATLESVVIGDCVTTLGEGMFDSTAWYNNQPDGVVYSGKALYKYKGIMPANTSITIKEGTTIICSGAFGGCSGLTSVEIPSSVTNIGLNAFIECHGLTNVEIGNGVTSIEQGAFARCNNLTSVVIPNTLTSIDQWAFSDSWSLKDVYISDLAAWCGIEFASDNANPLYYANNLYLNGELVTELVIPNGVTKIKDGTFRNCYFTSVVIPSGVTSIGDYAFSALNALIDIAAETPATVALNTFHTDAVIKVPCAAVDAYKAAWNTYANQIVAKELAVRSVEVEASEVGSALRSAIGDEFTTSVADLTVKGTINSYDVIVLRTKMPLLRNLDLSEATVVASDKAFYDGNFTKDNDLGGYAFYGLSKLNYVKLPKDLVSVGDYMFDGCSSLREIELPETVQSIGSYAFRNCDALKEIAIPAGVKSINQWTFRDCAALERVILPNGLETIGSWAFYCCRNLKDIKLPPTVKTIDSYAFEDCSSLEEIRIPSSVTSIGSSAFDGCNNLKKVYTYTVEPTAIQESTFSTFQTATLYVPSVSFSNYYWDDGWKRFLNLAEFNEPYEYFYVNNDYTLNDDTGYIEGTEGNAPDADINAGGGFIVEGEQGDGETPNQSLGDVNVGSNGEGTSGSIIGDNNLHIDDLHIRINVKGGRWYFFAFPFDIKLDKISMENGSDYVFRYYDGAERAQNGKGGWKDINENHLKAARGYIFQCAANDVLVLNIEDVKFKKEDKYNELVAHVSENLKDASWNFTGNPYLSYYDMADMDYTAPVTVWDGEKYVAIRPGDDDYHFAPYEAFFVQKPEGQENIAFDGEEQMTKNQSNKQKEKQAAARRARGIDPERLLINLVLGNGTSDDRTRIVFNERQSFAYETSCDATKFETAGVTQLYTIGSDKVHYAINERPADNGRVVLGYTAPTAGFYTIEAQRMDAEVYVKDFKTGTLHNLKDGAYSFGTDAGTFNDRFEILLKGTAPGTTGLNEVKGECGNVKGEIYDLQGRKMQDAGKGIYIINGEKVVK